MTSRRATIAGGALACLMLGAAAEVLRARDATRPLAQSDQRLLYLRSGRTADHVFLSFDALAADVYWIRTIQNYGHDRKSPLTKTRFQLLQPLLDLTTTLDAHFNVAYRFGAIFLSMSAPDGPGRTDQAIALLQKGLANNPSRWQYAHDIGFIHYWHTGDYGAAASWFERAAAMPGAPLWVRPLAAATLAQGGDRRGARQLLRELLTANEKYIRQAAERGLAQLQALDAIDQLQERVDQYHAMTGAYPGSWTDVINAGLLQGWPADPTAVPFAYDPATHRVELSKQSSLWPLPQAFGRP